MKESVRIFLIIFYFFKIAYSSQSKRRNFINEVIEEEDEDKNKEKNKNENNTDKYNKIMNKNNKQNDNIYPDNKKQKPVLIWSNSHFNKKTYENIYRKMLKGGVPKFFMLHTFSHAIMKDLEFSCGYPTASLSERLYFSDRMCGVLIYTADGAEGSWGRSS